MVQTSPAPRPEGKPEAQCCCPAAELVRPGSPFPAVSPSHPSHLSSPIFPSTRYPSITGLVRSQGTQQWEDPSPGSHGP